MPSCRISVVRFQPKFSLGDGVVGSFPPHLAGEWEGWSGGTSEKQRMGCCGHRSPLAAKGPPSGARQEPASHNHTIPLSSLYFFHTSQSKTSILTWFLAMKLAQHKPVNVLSLKLACQLKIRTHISKLFRQLSFMGSQPLLCLGFPQDPHLNRGLFFFLFF